MRPFKRLKQRRKLRAFKLLLAPIFERFKLGKELESRGYRPLQMTFDDQLEALIFYHLEEYSSGSELLQALEQNDFAKECVAPPKGIKKSSFFEAINNRCLEQTYPGRLTPLVDKILDKGETGVMDRGYQSHDHFDQWQDAEKFFGCRIRDNTHKTVIRL